MVLRLWESDKKIGFIKRVHLLAYELSVLFSMSLSLREEGYMQISEGDANKWWGILKSPSTSSSEKLLPKHSFKFLKRLNQGL